MVLHKKPTLPPSLEALSKQDACLFNHSRISNLRLSSLDLSPFGDLRGGFLSLPCMNVVWIEVRVFAVCTSVKTPVASALVILIPLQFTRSMTKQDCHYSLPALKNLLTSSTRLQSITLFDNARLPVDANQLQPILAPAAPTLKILKLMEPFLPLTRPSPFNLRTFRALRLLHIEPCLLLAPQAAFSHIYTSPSHPHLPSLIQQRLPPNLKILLLEAVTLPHNHVPVGTQQVISPRDMELLTCLVQRRDSVAPKLKGLFMMYHGENIWRRRRS